MKRSYEIDMCNGPLFSRLLLFALPLMLSGILQLLFNAADIVVVGQFAGSNAMAAVGSTSSLINLLVNLFIGISVGANVLVARYYGSRSPEDVEQTVHTALITGFIGGFVLIAIGIPAARPMLELMGTPADVLDQAVLYMRIYFIGMPATMLYNFGAAVLRASGDTRRPLYFLFVAGVVNVIFNLFFVIVLHMDVEGVAIATVISQFISAGLIILCLVRMEGMCHLDFSRLRFHITKFKQILRIGVPAGLQGILFSISNVLIQSSINSFGSTVVAGNTAASNIEGFVYTSMNAIYQTSLSFTSQNMGAKNYHRVDKVLIQCELLVAAIGLVLGNGAYLLGNQLLGIYSGDAQVIAYGLQRLSICCASYFLCGVMDVLAGSIRGLGYSIVPMLITFTGICLFRVVWVFTAFQWHPSLFTIYISYPISWLVTIVANLTCYLVARRHVFHPKEEGMPAATSV
ncbi:MAG TPA: MATE family efflux transporter [Firmicutes bacterium]|nr:MATE family efflux transporter [Bacillota bacterium]